MKWNEVKKKILFGYFKIKKLKSQKNGNLPL